jgi:LL-diaminopimelate aminotransferase
MTNKMQPAKRVLDLPPYIFKEIDNRKNLLIEKKVPLFNFGIGDPDMQTPDFVVEELCKQAAKNENQKYPSYNGSDAFREAVCQYMLKRFNVKLDPKEQATSLIGTKEGLAHFSWAFLDPGDLALVPDPGFPVYANSARFSGAEVHYMPLLEKNGFLPDLDKIPEEVARKAKLMFLNYPNNPTGAVAKKQDIQKIVDWALKHQIIVVSDAAYAELVYDEENRLSFLNAENAHKCVIEFHSFSKTFNMTGFRLGFAVGNTQLIQGLVQLKTNIDSGVFDAIQLAGIKALENLAGSAQNLMAEYRRRKNSLKKVLENAGIECLEPEGAFYLMARCPKDLSSMQYTIDLMEKCGIITTPCTGFGTYGEGYVRFALTQPTEIIEQLAQQLKKLN